MNTTTTRFDLSVWPHPPCDTHSHIYPDGVNSPGHPSLAEYLRVIGALGVGRHVIVHAKALRHDQRCTLDVVQSIGLERARAVVWEEASWNDNDLEQLHSAGVRGIRTLYAPGVPVDVAALQSTAAKIAPHGWHILVQAESFAWPGCVDALLALPCPVVVDHIGRLGPGVGLDSPEFQSLVRFVREGGWIKFAAPYYGTQDGAADFGELAPRLRAFLNAGSSRVIWGLNWPHLNLSDRPDEHATLESLLQVLDSEPLARAVLAENAARLYGFSATPV